MGGEADGAMGMTAGGKAAGDKVGKGPSSTMRPMRSGKVLWDAARLKVAKEGAGEQRIGQSNSQAGDMESQSQWITAIANGGASRNK